MSIPAVFITAYYCLTNVARVSAGQRLLIHLATSYETQVSVQVPLALGVDFFVTTTDATDKSPLIDRYKISENHII